ncbi:Sak single strand annealing protein [Lachnospiraceae bacterium LCP25S3_G4]
MALKNYDEMRKIEVRPFCEKRDDLTYLNWAMCIDLLHKHGAEKVYWEPIENILTGNSLRMSNVEFKDSKGNINRCYETRIKVVIDENVYEMQTPVMNGANPVKDNSMSQQRVWNSMCRAFVKCVAIHTGLGFDLWLKEEYNKMESNIPFTKEKNASKGKIETIQQLCISHGIDADAWNSSNNRTWETLTEHEAASMLKALKDRYGDD